MPSLFSLHLHTLFALPGISSYSSTWLMLPIGPSQVSSPLDQPARAPCSAQLTKTQLSTKNVGGRVAGLCRCQSCCPLLCWQGHGQEDQAVMRICLPMMTPSLRYWSLLPKKIGNLLRGSPDTPCPRIQAIAGTPLT